MKPNFESVGINPMALLKLGNNFFQTSEYVKEIMIYNNLDQSYKISKLYSRAKKSELVNGKLVMQ